MMKRAIERFVIVAFAFLGLPATSVWADGIQFLQPSSISPPDTLFGLDASGLDGQIEQALTEYTGFANLREFTVHWERPTFQCLEKSYEIYDVLHGVCLVETSAFQVAATALVVKGDRTDDFKISILSAAIE